VDPYPSKLSRGTFLAFIPDDEVEDDKCHVLSYAQRSPLRTDF
jgi:hypothetical protein